MQHLEFGRVDVVAARHAEIAQDELREEGQVEAQEDDEGGELGPSLGIHAAGHLRPPVVQAAEIGHDGAAHHDVVEVGHDEVRVGDMDVDAEAGHEQAGEAADGEEADKAEGIEHGRGVRDRPLIQSGRPVEDLDGGGDGDEVAEEREHHAGEDRLGADEEVVAPDEEAQNGDGDAREGDEVIAEDRLAGEGGDELADHAHGRQDHDVDGGVGVEPEEVLEEHGVAAEGRVEDAEVHEALAKHQDQGDGENGSAEDLDEAGGVVRPDEQGHAEPGHAGSAHAVDGDDEVEAGEDGREPGDEDAERRSDDPGVGVGGAERGVKRPAGIHAAGQHGEEGEESAHDQQVPAQQVDPGKRQVFSADHHRQKEIAERGGNGGDEEEENHRHAVHGEELVVGLGGNQVARGRE